MFLPNELAISTADKEIVGELLSQLPVGVTARMMHTRAVELEPVANFLISFASEASIAVFCVWLAARMEKHRAKKTTIEGHEIPANTQQITVVINLVLQQHQEQSQDNHQKDV